MRLHFFLSMGACPGRCVYCDQNAITGHFFPDIAGARALVERQRDPVELCFFGGSFTCLPEDVMRDWLSLVKHAPCGSTVRFSTHPLCITPRAVEIFSQFPVSIVELGISSLDDFVLNMSNRGYSGDDALRVIALLLDAGFDVCAQMMLGLPGQTFESCISDLEKLDFIRGEKTISLRIYPCLVLKNTPLEKMLFEKKFAPLTTEEAAEQAGELLFEARRRGFRVIRVGLHETPSLANSVIAGPHHPAFGELAEAHATAKLLHKISPFGDWQIEKKYISFLTGHGGLGIKKLASLAGLTPEQTKSKIKFIANEIAAVERKLSGNLVAEKNQARRPM